MSKPLKVTTKVKAPDVLDPEDNLLGLYDPTNPDITLFNLVDDEVIKLGGSKLFFYKYFNTGNQFDDVYMEERTKSIAKEPIVVYGHYDPRVVEEELNQFGLEVVNDQIFTFNKSYIDRKLSRPPISGDIIKPFFQNQRYEIFEVQEDSFNAYGVYHYRCSAKLLRDTEEVVDSSIDKHSEGIGAFLDGSTRPEIS